MKVLRIDHIGVVARGLNDFIKFYTDDLGLKVHGEEILETMGSKVTFLPCDDTEFEFLEATEKGSVVDQYYQGLGNCLQHVALEVDDIDEVLAHLKSRGVKLVDETPRYGAGGSRIAFVSPESTGGISVELCQKS